MPCLNAEHYIEEALRSVLLQGYPDLELIVFDGGSSDGTVEIIKRYAPWLTYWVSEPDRGQSHAINKGLDLSTGELFNWFNADDVMCPGALYILADLYMKNSESAGVVGVVQVFNDKGNLETLRPVVGTKEEFGNWAFPAFIPQPGALFKCSLCKSVGGLNEKLHYVMDIELIMRLAEHGRYTTTDQIITNFRQHPGSKTVQGDVAGLVELIAAEFAMGLPGVAETLLKRRMAGHAGLTIDRLDNTEIARIVDRWSYRKIGAYLVRRFWKNVRLRMVGRSR